MNLLIKELEEAFKNSIEDLVLSRKERKDLKEQLSNSNLKPNEADWLLSRLRDFAMEHAGRAHPEVLVAWFYEGAKLLRQATAATGNRSRAYFSPGEACRDAILSQLRAARKQIDICVFTISDNIIRDALVSAHKVGKRIRIISDNDKSNDMGSDIHFLSRLGIPVRLDETEDHMHHKFAVFDQRLLLNGSYNWTRSAAERNFENIALTEDPSLITAYQTEFDRLWKKLA
jgi:hypothetical protein